jgi:hypothetical protein
LAGLNNDEMQVCVSTTQQKAPATTRLQALFVHFGHGRHQQRSLNLLSSMHVSRRHSRHMLLPPGWVALGFLLLLGCQVLLAHRRQMRQERMIELWMPFLSKAEISPPLTDLSALERLRLYNPMAALKPSIRWHYVSFTGNPLNDSSSRVALNKIVLLIRANIGGAEGVQVRFGAGATYDSMIYSLTSSQEGCWFVNNGQISTFYIVSDWAFIPDEHYTRPLTFK